jgi:hypothetical protein
MTPVTAHVLGMPLEEAAAQLAPAAAALLVALRVTVRRARRR